MHYVLMGLVFLLVGCGSKTEVTTQLKLISQANTLRMGARATGDVTSENITIDSLQIPILDVSLGTGDALSGGAGNANTLYQCPNSTEAECRVELVGTALTNLLTSNNVQDVAPDTYTSVMVGTCADSDTYTALVKAKVTGFQGNTWYTQTGSATLTQSQADYGPVEISFSGCRNYSVLANPITIGESPTTVNLFIDLRNLLVVAEKDGPDLFNASGCSTATEPANDDPYICMGYPNVAGTIGATPVLKRYRLDSGGSGARLIGIYFDSNGTPVGGFDRGFFNGAYFEDSDAFGSFKRAYLADGNLVVTDYKDGNTDTITGLGDTTFLDFPDLSVGQSQSVAVTDSDGNPATPATLNVTRID